MTRLPGFAQRVVALDVSLRFVRQSQSLGRLYRRRVRWLPVDQAVQQVQNMRLRWLQRQFDGGEHGLLVVLECDFSWNRDPAAGLICIQSEPWRRWVHIGLPTTGRPGLECLLWKRSRRYG